MTVSSASGGRPGVARQATARPGVAGSARRAFAVSAGKTARAATRRLSSGTGSALPGTVMLAIDPGALAGLLAEIPRGTVLVTGSNGKGTTCRMLAEVMAAAGLHPVTNADGPNQPAGLASTLAAHAGLTGRLPRDPRSIGLFEVDEGSFPEILPQVSQPKAVVFTNMFRSQLDRDPDPANVTALAERAMRVLPAGTTLVLNADDPRAACVAADLSNPRLYFGIEDRDLCRGGSGPASDFPRCPRCAGELTYTCVYYAHLGHWACATCGMARPQPQVCLTKADLTGPFSTRLQMVTPATEAMLEIPLPGLYNACNALAAVAAATACQLPDRSLSAMETVTAGFFRMEKAPPAGHDVYLAVAKDASSYTEVLRAALGDRQPGGVLLGLDDCPARQPGTSWIWDADFASLAGLMPAPVICGNRAADLAVRLRYAGWAGSALGVEPDPVRAFQTALARTPAGQPLRVVATPAVLRELRRWLARQGYVEELRRTRA